MRHSLKTMIVWIFPQGCTCFVALDNTKYNRENDYAILSHLRTQCPKRLFNMDFVCIFYNFILVFNV